MTQATLPSETFIAKSWPTWAVALVSAPIALGIAGAVYFEARDMVAAVERLDGVPLIVHVFRVTLGVALVLVTAKIFLSFYRRSAPGKGFLRLDAAGLTMQADGEERSWSWTETSTFERDEVHGLRFFLPDLTADQARREPWVQGITPEGPMLVIGDLFDAPLEKIAGRLNDYRARALDGSLGDAAAKGAPATAAHDLPPMTFAAGRWHRLTGLMRWLPALAACAAVVWMTGRGLLGFYNPLKALPDMSQFAVAGFAGTGAMLAVLAIVEAFRHRHLLQFDSEGFTYTRAGKRRYWPWSEVTGFRCESVARDLSQIRFGLSKLDRKQAQTDQWVYQLTPDGPEVAIPDIYDAPLDEIAAKLNQYRNHGRPTPARGAEHT